MQIEEETRVHFKKKMYEKFDSKVYYVAKNSQKNVGNRERAFKEKPPKTRRQSKMQWRSVTIASNLATLLEIVLCWKRNKILQNKEKNDGYVANAIKD